MQKHGIGDYELRKQQENDYVSIKLLKLINDSHLSTLSTLLTSDKLLGGSKRHNLPDFDDCIIQDAMA